MREEYHKSGNIARGPITLSEEGEGKYGLLLTQVK
jgi:hypothetical protein